MKNSVLAGLFVAALAATALAQAPAGGAPKKAADQGGEAGHTAPKQQPATAPAPSAPTGTIALGSVRLPKGVKADGKPLAAGTYQVRVTGDAPTGNAPGESQGLERWAEFLQGGQVKGREVVTIIPQSEISQVQKDTPPGANAAKVETLKGGDYVRVWVNKGGNHYLVHLPTA